MMARTLRTPYGKLRIAEPTPQLTTVSAESDAAVYYGQGYVAGKSRLFQLELTRRIASGTTAALFGPSCVAADLFQRDLGLVALARREAQRDARTEQAAHVGAYVDGINRALDDTRILPAEFLFLRHRPHRFTVEDAYLTGQLKYFINSTWKFELLQTLIAGQVDAERFAQLFASYAIEGQWIDPLPREAGVLGALIPQAAEALRVGLAGLALLGLSSPDIGSNAFVVAGSRSRSGLPLLASDPHMGLVSPGFNLFFRLRSDEGLDVFGSHFPGTPGIVVGRNRDIAWGFVGLMADNQDLLLGELASDGESVRVAGGWQTLERREERIEVRGAAPRIHTSLASSKGRLLRSARGHALFLRWPALDTRLGSITLRELNRAHDWQSFRAGLAEMKNAPMVAVYADRRGNIGLQATGLIPRRSHAIGGLVLAMDHAEHDWQGYVDADELPRQYNPESGVIVYANQYSTDLFAGRPAISTRWHPPTRALRILERIAERAKHDPGSFAAIQDDCVDGFARAELPWLRAQLDAPDSFPSWSGDTRETEAALLFERWMSELTRATLVGVVPDTLAAAYSDQWPGFRWNTIEILKHHAHEWGHLDPRIVVQRALQRAQRPEPHPAVEYRHALRRHPLGKVLFGIAHAYDGGSRESVHVARRNIDFLSAGQGGAAPSRSRNFSFGPSFKFVYDLGPSSEVHYLSNAPNRGSSLRPALLATLRRWQRRRRFTLKMD